tara:strand:- start:857 stop:1045 length:189 start_codon:yes stop_codon:yes gene_type:complete
MEKVNVKWEVNFSSGNEDISLEELACDTIEAWNALDKDEQCERLQTALDELPERTCIVVDSW